MNRANSLIPLLLDTDIGSDIDDAVALAYLLRQNRCELLGITTVTGDVAKRCAIADYLCRAAGRDDIPILAGASKVLEYGRGQPHVPHYDAIAGRARRKRWRQGAAIDFLRNTIRSRPGEITLLSIGPFTNIAQLFAADREIPRLLKGFVSMAGFFFAKPAPAQPPPREWNCLVDPVATTAIYRARVHGHTSFGIDVTSRCQLPATDVRRRFNRPPLDAVLPMAERWFQQHEMITFHDPLAAACIFNPALCRYARGLVQSSASVIEPRQGLTRFTPAPAGPHRVARTVNVPAFFNEYFSVF